jgi:uracil-DNA glycosylase family 4
MSGAADPPRDCGLCPRLSAFRDESRARNPGWFNAPVPSFGPLGARLLIVGLAPGLKGANRTGRPFTGDFAGDLLYAKLLEHGLAAGHYHQRPDDGLALIDCRITNGVRCVPPRNKPTGPEINACRPFLTKEIAAMPNLRCVLALGAIAHGTVLSALGQRKSGWRFAHGALHRIPGGPVVADSYHCSRYNTNTGRLTTAMFDSVIATVRAQLAG